MAKAKAKKITKAKAPAKKAAKKVVKKATKIVAKKSAPVAAKKAIKKIAVKKVLVKKVAKKAVKKIVAKKITAKKGSVKPTARPAFVIKKGGGMPEKLLEATLKIMDDRKAEDINVIDLAGRSAMADYIVVASGNAARQIAAIAQYLQDAYFKLGIRNVRMEGLTEGNWVLVDCGDVIVHLFRPEVREYYNLESLWQRPTAKTQRSARSR